MKPVKPKPRKPINRSEWIAGAIEVLADEAMAGMYVEALTKRFGVSKSSFYWHFKDRQDLFTAVLQTWKNGRIRDIDKQGSSATRRPVLSLQK